MALAHSPPDDGQEHVAPNKKGYRDSAEDPLEPKVQGALLLQSLLRLDEPYNELVTNRRASILPHYILYLTSFAHSIKSLPMEDLLKLAHHPTSSRVLDVIFESTTVPYKVKRNFAMSFIGHYHALVDDRIGSRIGDRCWAFADPYLRVSFPTFIAPDSSC